MERAEGAKQYTRTAQDHLDEAKARYIHHTRDVEVLKILDKMLERLWEAVKRLETRGERIVDGRNPVVEAVIAAISPMAQV